MNEEIFSPPSRKQINERSLLKINELFQHYSKLDLDFGTRGHYYHEYCSLITKSIYGLKNEVRVVAVNSGTSSIWCALRAIDLNAGEEVIASPITDPGMISPILILGGIVRLYDYRPNNYFGGLDEIKSIVSSKTKAILINHNFGKINPEIQAIAEFASSRGIFLIEDISQAHGANLNGRIGGSFGDYACCSTMYSKSHTTGGTGGFVAGQNSELYEKLLRTADRGKKIGDANFNEKDPSLFMGPELNLMQNEILCAIGTVTFSQISNVNKKRREFLKRLDQNLKKASIPLSLEDVSEGDAPFYWPMHFLGAFNKNDLAHQLRKRGILINSDYKYLASEWPWLKTNHTPNAKAYRDQTINLLFNENYDEGHAEVISDIIKSIFN